jgi:hypothetical protein
MERRIRKTNLHRYILGSRLIRPARPGIVIELPIVRLVLAVRPFSPRERARSYLLPSRSEDNTPR